jgi:EAL domain-containing protein (putative c-di-GMP-specific phosphodiesterase class I)
VDRRLAARTVAEAVVRLGEAFRLTVVAEGIETEPVTQPARPTWLSFGR